MIRPPDPYLQLVKIEPTLTVMAIESDEAVRRLIDLCFRDCWTAIDLTWGDGGFWKKPPIPGLVVTANNLDPVAPTPFHRDFTATGFGHRAFDLAVFDPPHLADGGADGIMASRYGSVATSEGLKALIQRGAAEAARIARLGVLAKVADHSHGGELLQLSRWVEDAVREARGIGRPYAVLHTYKPSGLIDRKWQVQRVPRVNHATYLCFRLDDHHHKDFERLYARQRRDR